MANINFLDDLEIEQSIIEAVGTGLIHRDRHSLRQVRPRLVYNNRHKGETMLSVLLDEIQSCESFWFVVAFVNESGLQALKLELLEAARRGVKGRILTSTYLKFNSPKTFRELLKLSNVEVRICETRLHSKGYYFSHGSYSNLIVGSSNLTMGALQENKEWNLKVSSLEEGAALKASMKNLLCLMDKGL